MKNENKIIPKSLCFFLILLISTQFLISQESSKKEKKKREPLSEASKIWLEEVVPYIINDTEKEIFINLPSEIDRGKFIENFWRKRDPNPSTEKNEFKLEYYRRIALANKFFGSSAIKGWRTDRGKIFILLGPPNEIQRNLNPSYLSSQVFHGPKEIWSYWNLPNPKLPPNLEFVFIDQQGTGNYVLDTNLRLWQGEAFDLDIDDISFQLDYIENISEAMKNPFEKLNKLKGIITTQVTYDQIPFDYDLFYLKGKEKKILVPIVVKIPYSNIPNKMKGDKYCYSLTLVANASNSLGQIVFEKSKDINFKISPNELASREGETLRVQTTLYLEPDVTNTHLLIIDNFSGKVSTSHQDISFPDFDTEELILSDVFLFSKTHSTENKTRDEQEENIAKKNMFSDIQYVFHNNQEMCVFFEVYNLTLDKKTGLNNFKIEYLFFLDGQLMTSVSPPRPKKTSEKNCSIQTSFKLKNFEKGDYSLRAIVIDENRDISIEKEMQFRVIH